MSADRPGRASRRPIRRFAAVALAVVVALFVIEVGVRLSDADVRLRALSLYYQDTNPDVYRLSDDLDLRYELRPGTSSMQGDNDAAELPYEHFDVHVSAEGARGLDRDPSLSEGRFRVLALGGSTMFGHGVRDDETVPAALEAVLNDRGIAAESWNYAAQAYTLGQASRAGLAALDSVDPQLIVVQLLNVGRRPFLGDADRLSRDYDPWFDRDPSLYQENYPVPAPLAPVHTWLASRSAGWVAVSAAAKLAWGRNESEFADAESCRVAAELGDAARGRGVPFVYLLPPCTNRMAMPSCALAAVPDATVVDLYEPDREPQWYQIHPPPDVLAEWAERLAAALDEAGILPASASAEPAEP